MGGIKRAGLFIIDGVGNTCCVVRSSPYGAEVYRCKRNRTTTCQVVHRTQTGESFQSTIEPEKEEFSVLISSTITNQPKYNIQQNVCERRRSSLQKTSCAYQSFVEMIQIPRGTKEKDDQDLLQTAIREFCEETLCANSQLYVQVEPVKLYWVDCGKRWTYNIYIANVKSRLYFAFRPSLMERVEMRVHGVSGRDHSYHIYTTTVSRNLHSGVTNRLVVMKTLDYIDYMRNCQLQYYGENNYRLLFDRLEELYPHPSPNGGDQIITTTNNVPSSPSTSRDNNGHGERWLDLDAVSFPKGFLTITPAIYRGIKNNRDDMYLQHFEPMVYSVGSENQTMDNLWSLFWKRICPHLKTTTTVF